MVKDARRRSVSVIVVFGWLSVSDIEERVRNEYLWDDPDEEENR